MNIFIAYEDVLQEHVLEKLFQVFSFNFNILSKLSRHGKGYLSKNAKYFNNVASEYPVILLADLDNAPCPIHLILDWVGNNKHTDFLVRIAVREVESWLLADKNNFSSFLGISPAKMKFTPDDILNPKEYIINLARNSKNRGIRNDIPPSKHSTACIGPGYNKRLINFINSFWDPRTASIESRSLSKAITSISALHNRLIKATPK